MTEKFNKDEAKHDKITIGLFVAAAAFAIPTAVITESNEKTTSSKSTCTITRPKDGLTRAEA